MNIALVAHDSRKKELIEWVEYNYETLVKHKLFATGTTGKIIENIMINVSEYDDTIDTEYIHAIEPFKNNITIDNNLSKNFEEKYDIYVYFL